MPISESLVVPTRILSFAAREASGSSTSASGPNHDVTDMILSSQKAKHLCIVLQSQMVSARPAQDSCRSESMYWNIYTGSLAAFGVTHL